MRRLASDVLRELQQRVARLENLRNTSSRKASLKTRLANRQVIAKFYLRDLKKLKKNHVDMLKALIKFLNKQMGTTDITNVDNVDIDSDGMMTVKLKRPVNGHKEWHVATEDVVKKMAIDYLEFEVMDYSKPRYISLNDYVSDYVVDEYNESYRETRREDVESDYDARLEDLRTQLSNYQIKRNEALENNDSDEWEDYQEKIQEVQEQISEVSTEQSDALESIEDDELVSDADELIEMMMDEQGLSWENVVSALGIDTRRLAEEAVDMDGIAVSIGADEYWDIRGARNSYVAFTR